MDLDYDDGRWLNITRAHCSGMDGGRFHRHFGVYFRDNAGFWRCGILHVTGRYTWRISHVALDGRGACG